MNFIVESGQLLAHLQNISGALNTSSSLPILENFLFEIKDSKLTVSASDLETTMKTTFAIETKEDGSIAIPAKMLMDILKNLPDHPLTFTVDTDNFGIAIASDYGKYKIVGFDAKDFPKAPQPENVASIKLNGSVIAEAITQTLFATGNDELRPVMNGVFCQFGGKSATFVATDAHRLVTYKRDGVKASKEAEFILPKKPLNLLKQNLTGDEDVQISFNESNAVFIFNDSELSCRLIEGNFPNYQAVIPENNPNKLTIDRQALLSSLKRVSIFSNKTTYQTKLRLAGNQLTISAEDLDLSNQASEVLECTYDGEDMEIGFSSKFLIDMLNNIQSKDVMMELSDPRRPGIILPVEQPEGAHILMLVMPVML